MPRSAKKKQPFKPPPKDPPPGHPMYKQYHISQPQRNFATRTRSQTKCIQKMEPIFSAAETELGRRLTQDEVSALTSKFPPDKIIYHIEKVRINHQEIP